MDLLNKDEFFKAAAVRHEDVPVGKRLLRLGELTADGRDMFLTSIPTGANLAEFQARLVAATAIDDAGALVFTAADIENLRRLPAGVLNTLANAASRLNGIGQQALEDAEKNSEAAQSGDSQSGSPSPSASQSGNSSNG